MSNLFSQCPDGPLDRAAKRMSQHTPGPWKLAGIHRSRAEGKSAFYEIGDDVSAFWIAKVQTFDDDNGRYAANARLIASAPELLQELLHLVRLLEPVEDTLNVPGLATLNGARAAIAKAEGRS